MIQIVIQQIINRFFYERIETVMSKIKSVGEWLNHAQCPETLKYLDLVLF